MKIVNGGWVSSAWLKVKGAALLATELSLGVNAGSKVRR